MSPRQQPTPPDLDAELSRIRDQLHQLRRDTQQLTREFVWLSAAGLSVDELGDPLTPAEALELARNSLDDFGSSLGLAADAADVAQRYTTRLRFR